jgi:hypothetical protein
MAGKKFRFEGTARRIRQRIAELGYESIGDFWKAHPHYKRQTIYALCDEERDRFPATHLSRLARDLGVTKGWILFGDEHATRTGMLLLPVAFALCFSLVAISVSDASPLTTQAAARQVPDEPHYVKSGRKNRRWRNALSTWVQGCIGYSFPASPVVPNPCAYQGA